MPKARSRRVLTDDTLSPQERARLIDELDRRMRETHRVFVRKKWEGRCAARAAGRPSIGLPLIWMGGPKVTPRYGRNNPLRYQKTNESSDRLDQSGSRL